MRDDVNTKVWLALVTGSALMAAFVPVGSLAGHAGPPDTAEPWHKYTAGDRSSYLTAWSAFYPSSTIPDRMATAAGQSCFLCHETSGRRAQGNCYRMDLKAKLDQGMNIEQAIAAVDGDDSDNDGTPNGAEILMVRHDNPAEIGYNPGLIGPTGTSPCSASPTTPVSNQPETPLCYADCDGNAALDIFDFLCFQNSFVAGEPYACDCEPNPACDIFDFLCFQNAFVAGCP